MDVHDDIKIIKHEILDVRTTYCKTCDETRERKPDLSKFEDYKATIKTELKSEECHIKDETTLTDLKSEECHIKNETTLKEPKNEPTQDPLHIEHEYKPSLLFKEPRDQEVPTSATEYVNIKIEPEFVESLKVETTCMKADYSDDEVKCVHADSFSLALQKLAQQKFDCKICKRKCSIGDELHINVPVCRQKEILKCPECNYKSTYKSKIVNHMRIHSKIKMACTFCDFKTTYKKSLQRHMKTHNRASGQRFQCSACDYATAYEYNMKQHIKDHMVAGGFQCHLCGKKVGNYRELDRHLTVHVKNDISTNLNEASILT